MHKKFSISESVNPNDLRNSFMKKQASSRIEMNTNSMKNDMRSNFMKKQASVRKLAPITDLKRFEMSS